MQSGAERQLTAEQARDVLSNEARKLIDGFSEALQENQAFKDALAEIYLRESDLSHLFIGFTHRDNRYSFISAHTGEFMRVLKYDAGDELYEGDVEDLDIDCSSTDPIICYRQRTGGVWGEGCRGSEAIGLAQKLLDGLKPGEKS